MMPSTEPDATKPAQEDQELVRRILAGDEEAFRGFFNQHVRGLYRFVLSRVDRDHETTQEIVQSTLVKAVESFKSYRGDGALTSWLYSICRFEIHAYFRRKMGTPREEPYDAVKADSLVSAADDPSAALDRKEVGRLVHETLDRLPGHYGNVLEWKYIDGLRVKQIAVRLGVGSKAAESLLTRARKLFRHELDRAGKRWRAIGWRTDHE